MLKEVGNSKLKKNNKKPLNIYFSFYLKNYNQTNDYFTLRDLYKWIFCKIKFILGFVYLS